MGNPLKIDNLEDRYDDKDITYDDGYINTEEVEDEEPEEEDE